MPAVKPSMPKKSFLYFLIPEKIEAVGKRNGPLATLKIISLIGFWDPEISRPISR
jgi:hypothetical protein